MFYEFLVIDIRCTIYFVEKWKIVDDFGTSDLHNESKVLNSTLEISENISDPWQPPVAR